MKPQKLIKDPDKWDIKGLETFFSKTVLPKGEIQLSPGIKISNVKVFVASHLAMIKVQNQVLTYRPYYERLMKLKSILS